MISFKLIASQAKTINRFRNLRTKIAKCSANIHFNHQCLKCNITLKYAQIKIPNTSPASQRATLKAGVLRIKEELKFLHKKKDTINRELYKCHLQAAHEWGNNWTYIQECITHKINKHIEKKYKTMEEKIRRLKQSSTHNQKTDLNFYPRVINNTNINFSDEEMNLLRKGLKYNLSKKPKNWIRNLALEAETAVTLLPQDEQEYARHQIAKNIERLFQQQKLHNTHTMNKGKKRTDINKTDKRKTTKEQCTSHKS